MAKSDSSRRFINQAPALPSYYVPRPREIDKVKQYLLQETLPDTLVVSAIYGLGGIGKSVLVSALAVDVDIQKRFDGGILWVTLGNEPNILSLLTDWIAALGDKTYRPTSEQAASQHLHTLLNNRRMLLVVDDVWNPVHADYFRVGQAGCCVLVTTREAIIADAERCDMEVMSPDEAMTLVAQAIDRPLTDGETNQAKELAKAVGYLPLALELAATQIGHGATWEGLLAGLTQEIARLEDFGIPENELAGSGASENRNRSLIASLNLSLSRLPSELLRQFTWLGILPEDVAITEGVATTLWQLPKTQSAIVLNELSNRALLLTGPIQQDGSHSYRLHDIVRYLTKRLIQQATDGDLPGLGLTLPEAHSHLIEIYQQQLPHGLWHELQPDGYIHGQLMWHLEQANQIDEIHRIFEERTASGRNGWYEACDRLGQPALFVSHLIRAWTLAEHMYIVDPHRAIVLQMRYALIRTTMNNLVGNIPAELIETFVKKGFWSPVKAFAHVEQIQDVWQQSAALDLLIPLLPEELSAEALRLVTQLPDEDSIADGLVQIGKYFPSLRQSVLDLMGQLNPEKIQCKIIMGRLAEHLSLDLLAQALQQAQQIEDDCSRAVMLYNLAPHLPQKLLADALEAANQIETESYQALALCGLNRYISDDPATVLALVSAIDHEWYRAFVLRDLAEHVSPDQLVEVLHLAADMQDEGRWSVLSDVAPHLPKDLFREVLRLIADMQDDTYRSLTWADVAEYLPESCFEEALNLTEDMQHMYSRCSALCSLVNCLPEHLFGQVLSIISDMRDDSHSSDLLLDIGHHIPTALLPNARSIVASIEEESSRLVALCGLEKDCPELHTGILTRLCEEVKYEWDQAKIIRRLAPYLSQALFEACLQVISEMDDDEYQAEALCELPPHVLRDHCVTILRIVAKLEDEECRSDILRGLAPHLPEDYFAEALQITLGIQDDQWRLNTLLGLDQYARSLSLQELHQALTYAMKTGENECQREAAVDNFMANLPKNSIPLMLQMISEWQDERDRAWLLSELIKHLSEDCFEAALEVVSNIQDEDIRWPVLVDLGINVPAIYVDNLLQATSEIQDDHARTCALLNFFLSPPKNYSDRYFLPHVGRVLQMISEFQDEDHKLSVLDCVARYLPAGDDAFKELLQIIVEIQDQECRYKALIDIEPYIPEGCVEEALRIATASQSEESPLYLLRNHVSEGLQHAAERQSNQIQVLSLPILVEDLPEAWFQSALQLASEIQEEEYRHQSLTSLATVLPEHLFGELLQIVSQLQNEEYRCQSIIDLAPSIPKSLFEDLLQMVLAIQDEEYRCEALGYPLGAFIGYLPEHLSMQVLQAISEFQNPRNQAKALSYALQYLPEECCVEILRITSRLNESDRAYVLGSLRQYLPASQLREAFQIISRMSGNPWDNVKYILEHLPNDLLKSSLEQILALPHDSNQSSALGYIATYLPENLFGEALQIIKKMQSEKCRADTLHEMVAYLPPIFVPNALDIVNSCQESTERSKALSALVPHFDWKSLSFTDWSEIIRELTFRRRQDLIKDLPKLAPAILHYGNEDTLREVVTVMEEVCEQWR